MTTRHDKIKEIFKIVSSANHNIDKELVFEKINQLYNMPTTQSSMKLIDDVSEYFLKYIDNEKTKEKLRKQFAELKLMQHYCIEKFMREGGNEE